MEETRSFSRQGDRNKAKQCPVFNASVSVKVSRGSPPAGRKAEPQTLLSETAHPQSEDPEPAQTTGFLRAVSNQPESQPTPQNSVLQLMHKFQTFQPARTITKTSRAGSTGKVHLPGQPLTTNTSPRCCQENVCTIKPAQWLDKLWKHRKFRLNSSGRGIKVPSDTTGDIFNSDTEPNSTISTTFPATRQNTALFYLSPSSHQCIQQRVTSLVATIVIFAIQTSVQYEMTLYGEIQEVF